MLKLTLKELVRRSKISKAGKCNTEKFIEKAKLIHGDRYDYSKVHYVDYLTNTIIGCKKHGDFAQTPNVHLGKHGCPKCKGDITSQLSMLRMTSNIDEWLVKAKKQHGDTYSYNRVIYKRATQVVKITCRLHGDFLQRPCDHQNGQGCPKCGMESKKNKLKKDPQEFLQKAISIHKDAYDYSECFYVNSSTRVKLSCRVHGKFTVNPREHLKGSGCPDCKSTRYSRISIQWIKEYARSHRLKNVRHAHSGGEYHIPGTKFRVDGYHPASKTVLEFHGDIFHGNPKIFKPKERVHPFNNKTAGELYKETMDREAQLRQLGYTVVSIWESDYRNSIAN